MKRLLLSILVILALPVQETQSALTPQTLEQLSTRVGGEVKEVWESIPQSAQITIISVIGVVVIGFIATKIITAVRASSLKKSQQPTPESEPAEPAGRILPETPVFSPLKLQEASDIIALFRNLDRTLPSTPVELTKGLIESFARQDTWQDMQELANAINEKFSQHLFGSDEDVVLTPKITKIVDTIAQATFAAKVGDIVEQVAFINAISKGAQMNALALEEKQASETDRASWDEFTKADGLKLIERGFGSETLIKLLQDHPAVMQALVAINERPAVNSAREPYRTTSALFESVITRAPEALIGLAIETGLAAIKRDYTQTKPSDEQLKILKNIIDSLKDKPAAQLELVLEHVQKTLQAGKSLPTTAAAQQSFVSDALANISVAAQRLERQFTKQADEYKPQEGTDQTPERDMAWRRFDTLAQAAQALSTVDVNKPSTIADAQKALTRIVNRKDSLLKVRDLQESLIDAFQPLLNEEQLKTVTEIVNTVTAQAVKRIQAKQSTRREISGMLRQAAILDALTNGQFLKDFATAQANVHTAELATEFTAFATAGGIQGIRNGAQLDALLSVLQRNTSLREILFNELETLWESPTVLNQMSNHESTFYKSYIAYDLLTKTVPSELLDVVTQAAVAAIKRDSSLGPESTLNIDHIKELVEDMQKRNYSLTDQRTILTSAAEQLKKQNMPTEQQKITEFEQHVLAVSEPGYKTGYQPVAEHQPEPRPAPRPIDVKPTQHESVRPPMEPL